MSLNSPFLLPCIQHIGCRNHLAIYGDDRHDAGQALTQGVIRRFLGETIRLSRVPLQACCCFTGLINMYHALNGAEIENRLTIGRTDSL